MIELIGSMGQAVTMIKLVNLFSEIGRILL